MDFLIRLQFIALVLNALAFVVTFSAGIVYYFNERDRDAHLLFLVAFVNLIFYFVNFISYILAS